MSIAVIAALSRNRAIGRENRLPWHLPEDLARFKALTMHRTLVVGRKTYESIGRPLPGRKMIVVTRRGCSCPEGVRAVGSIEEAVGAAKPGETVFVGGGAEIFRQTLPLADRLYLTIVDAEVEGDTFFPAIDPSEWDLGEYELRSTPDPRFPRLLFATLERVGPRAGAARKPVPAEAQPLLQCLFDLRPRAGPRRRRRGRARRSG